MINIDITINKIIRSNRRSVSIEINSSGEIIVRVPLSASASEINKIIDEKQNWIRRKLQEIKVKIGSQKPKAFVWGENIFYLGDEYTILPLENSEDAVILDNAFRINTRYSDRLKSVILHWYWMRADKYLKDRTIGLARQIGTNFNKASLTNAGKKWGSCSSGRNIRLSWRLVMLPPDIIDYVIIHELSHLRELNHSKKFWNIVGTLMPDYEQREQWLKDNGHKFKI